MLGGFVHKDSRSASFTDVAYLFHDLGPSLMLAVLRLEVAAYWVLAAARTLGSLHERLASHVCIQVKNDLLIVSSTLKIKQAASTAA